MNKRTAAIMWLITAVILIFSSCTMQGDISDAASFDISAPSLISEDSSFEIHFIDVGQADSALIICDGHVMMIDGGNTDASSTIYTYLTKLGISYIDVMVATHSDADHVGGLPAALTKAETGVVYCPVTERDTSAFRNFKNKATARGLQLTVPDIPTEFNLGSARVRMIAPLREYEDNNNNSIILRIVYGENSFLFVGDAEREAEYSVAETNETLKSDVLKVGHHGSNSSSTYLFLREVMPKYAVISCGRNNDYGHPHEPVLSRLKDCGAVVYRTDLSGDIICRSDGKEISFTASGVHSIVTNIIGNAHSKIFHSDSCASLPSDRNRVYFDTRDEALENGFKPCPNCNP